jgi:hypothetical protein
MELQEFYLVVRGSPMTSRLAPARVRQGLKSGAMGCFLAIGALFVPRFVLSAVVFSAT